MYIDINTYCDGVILSDAKDLSVGSACDFARCFTSFNMTRYVLDNCYIITKELAFRSVCSTFSLLDRQKLGGASEMLK